MDKTSKSGKSRGNRRKRPGGMLLPLQTVMPPTHKVIHTYSINTNLTESAAGAGGTYFFRLNSVYDPDSSGVGTTATGYSTFAALFLNYRVRRVTVRFHATAAGLTSGQAIITVAPVARQAVVPSNPLLWRSMRFAQTDTLAPVTLGGHNLMTFAKTFDLPTILGVTPAQYRNDLDFSSTIGANPAVQAYLLVGVQSNSSGIAATAVYSLDITYEVEWFNPIPLQF
jgi:hypothetical protein